MFITFYSCLPFGTPIEGVLIVKTIGFEGDQRSIFPWLKGKLENMPSGLCLYANTATQGYKIS